MINRYRWHILTVLAGATLIILLLLALKPAEPRAGAINVQPVRGGDYSEALVGTLQRLNPVFGFRNPVDQSVNRLIFSGLIRFDSSGIPIPDLAEGWILENEDTSYTFILRPDALWHDGTPVTSADVVYTYGLLQSGQYPGPQDLAALWRSVTIEALTSQLVRFQLPEPYAPFLDYLTVGLLPAHILGGLDVTELDQQTFNLQPVGSGPFRLEELELDGEKISGVSLVPFEQYYGGRPFLDRVRFRYYPSQDAAWRAFESGEVMGLSGIRPSRLPMVLEETKWKVYTARLPESSIVFLNLKNDEVAFFQQREVRRALLLSLNRQFVIDRILGGQAIVANGPLLPDSWAADPNLRPDAHNPEEAVRLLDAAGWVLPTGASAGTDTYIRMKDDAALTFTLLYADDALHKLVAEELQRQWAMVGIHADVRAAPLDKLVEDLSDRIYQAALIDLDLSLYPDPDPYPFWNQTQIASGQNFAQFDDRSISETLELARIETVLENRARLYRNFQYRFNYQVPSLFLWHPTYTYAVDARILGLSLGPLYNPSDRLANIARWFMMMEQ